MISIDGVEMVGVAEAAVLADRSQETIRRWVWSGRIPAVKSGQKLYVRRSDVARTTPREERAGSTMSLAEWAARLDEVRTGAVGASAADLVIEDRRRRR